MVSCSLFPILPLKSAWNSSLQETLFGREFILLFFFRPRITSLSFKRNHFNIIVEKPEVWLQFQPNFLQ
jgi:hypothetical protein